MKLNCTDKKISETEEYRNFALEIEYLVEFFESLSDLFYTRPVPFITNKNVLYLNMYLIESSAKTLESVALCCSIGSFSDANTLVRRFRDDLLLYVYMLDIIKKRAVLSKNDTFNTEMTDDEMAVSAWLENSVNILPTKIKKKLSFENYMNVLKKNESVTAVIEKYNLEGYWETLRVKFNDYVHNNGIQVVHQNLATLRNKDLSIQLKNVIHRASYISSFFFILMLMVDSSLISSTDYTDYLECDLEPPEESQYLVAPFVQEFIDLKLVRLHPELKQYLKDRNISGMRIE